MGQDFEVSRTEAPLEDIDPVAEEAKELVTGVEFLSNPSKTTRCCVVKPQVR